jgi:hypothetical protein
VKLRPEPNPGRNTPQSDRESSPSESALMEFAMQFDSRFVVFALALSTALALGSGFAFAQDKTNRAAAVSMDDLVKDGYEIKAMERGTERAPFVVLLQRGAEMKSCILRISRENGRTPARESICF